MKNKLGLVSLLVMVFALSFTSTVSAEEAAPEGRIRLIGKITQVDATMSSFEMEARSGEARTIALNEGTKYRSPGGKIQSFDDLVRGMHVIVIGLEQGNGTILANVIGAVDVAQEQDTIRAVGEITGVVVPNGSFSLRARDDRIIRFETDDQTRYRSREGVIKGLEDLEPGMKALVVARPSQDGSPMALLIVAGKIDDLPPIRRYNGEVSSVNPDLGRFTVLTEDDQELDFKTSERTRFRSPDGEIDSVEDLYSGVPVQIGAIVNEDGAMTALLVAAGFPRRPVLDVKTGGRIVEIDEGGFKIEMRNGDSMSFVVDETTRYVSKDGSVKGFEDLEVGMFAFVGGENLDRGDVLAHWIGAGRSGTVGGRETSSPSFDLEQGHPPDPMPSGITG